MRNLKFVISRRAFNMLNNSISFLIAFPFYRKEEINTWIVSIADDLLFKITMFLLKGNQSLNLLRKSKPSSLHGHFSFVSLKNGKLKSLIYFS